MGSGSHIPIKLCQSLWHTFKNVRGNFSVKGENLPADIVTVTSLVEDLKKHSEGEKSQFLS